jgi:hypothetical protein
MSTKQLLATVICLVVLAAVPAYSQFPPAGNETTGSFGGFKILVEPTLAHLFTGCPGWDPASRIFTSPLLYDPATVISVSAATTEGTPHPHLRSPFPDPPATTREVHTQIQKLNLATYPTVPPPNSVFVRAGASASSTPASPGEVESESASGNPANDFPARSFFDVFVQITLPACGTGGFTGATLYNRHTQPLIVQASNLTAMPPTVVYEHNASSEVAILFGTAGRQWKRDEFLGCIILAGHEVGVAGTPEGGKGGGGKGGKGGKGVKREPEIEAAERGRGGEFEKHKEAFVEHMKEAERHMPHECRAK